jgi:rRNA maturation RNase YbeY
MIAITNQQRAYTIDIKKMETHVAAMLVTLGYPQFDVGILICGTKRMQNYNRDFRQKDQPTDILSFPYDDTRRPHTPIEVNDPEDANLGDIILCPEYIARRSREWERSFDEHLTALLAHGLAHLLGHDHHTDEEHAAMAIVEKQLIDSVDK